jgi:hypothetical protein
LYGTTLRLGDDARARNDCDARWAKRRALIDDIVRKQALYTEHVGADVDENGTPTPTPTRARRRIGRGAYAPAGRTLGEGGGEGGGFDDGTAALMRGAPRDRALSPLVTSEKSRIR